MADKTSVILVLVIAGLGLAVLLPEQKNAADTILESATDATEQQQAGIEAIDREIGGDVPSGRAAHKEAALELPPDVEAFIAEPLRGASHRFFPLKAGAKWTYLVKGVKYLVPGQTWTLEVIRPPTATEPGEVRSGFGDVLQASRVWLEDGGVRLDGLPFVEPLQFLGNRPQKVSGDFVPFPGAIIEGSTWTSKYAREVNYEYTDPRGRLRSGPAKAIQTDRAEVKGFEDVRLQSGAVRAVRIDWEARVDVTMDGREVLETLTTEAYRRESTWLAEGIGVVRRQVSYFNERSAQITMDLIRFEYP